METVSSAVTIARPNSGVRIVCMAGSFPWWSWSEMVMFRFGVSAGRLSLAPDGIHISPAIPPSSDSGSLCEKPFFLEQQFLQVADALVRMSRSFERPAACSISGRSSRLSWPLRLNSVAEVVRLQSELSRVRLPQELISGPFLRATPVWQSRF